MAFEASLRAFVFVIFLHLASLRLNIFGHGPKIHKIPNIDTRSQVGTPNMTTYDPQLRASNVFEMWILTHLSALLTAPRLKIENGSGV